jgi:hypothetical protein
MHIWLDFKQFEALGIFLCCKHVSVTILHLNLRLDYDTIIVLIGPGRVRRGRLRNLYCKIKVVCLWNLMKSCRN